MCGAGLVGQSGLQSRDRLCNLTGEQIFVTDWGVLHRPAGQRGGLDAREPAASLDAELGYPECGPRISSTRAGRTIRGERERSGQHFLNVKTSFRYSALLRSGYSWQCCRREAFLNFKAKLVLSRQWNVRPTSQIPSWRLSYLCLVVCRRKIHWHLPWFYWVGAGAGRSAFHRATFRDQSNSGRSR